MIHVIATIELLPGQREAFLVEFLGNVPLVRAEVGCIDYGPTLDLPTDIGAQIPPREDVVTVVERWESLSALKAHISAPHMLQYRERVKGMVKKVQLQVLEPVVAETVR